MSLWRIIVLGSVTAMVFVGIAFAWPVPKRDIPERPAYSHNDSAARIELLPLFDHTKLPERRAPKPAPRPVAPPPDPARALKSYKYLGMAASDFRVAGVFSGNGETHVLREEETLEGFPILNLNAAAAVLIVEGAEYSMPLNDPNN